MPGPDHGLESAAEYAVFDPEQEVCPALEESHLPPPREELLRNRLDRGFDARGRRPFPTSMALDIVRDGMLTPPALTTPNQVLMKLSGVTGSQSGFQPPHEVLTFVEDGDNSRPLTCNP